MERKIAVVLLFQNRLVRESIARILEKQIDLHVVANRAPTPDSKEEIIKSRVDVVVLDSLQLILEQDISVPRPGPKEHPNRCLLIGMADDPKLFLTAVRRGVSGYVLQDASAADVVAAIRAAARGEATCPPHYTRLLFDCLATQMSELPNSRRRLRTGLTGREQQLIPLLGRGLTNKELATHLSLSEHTVKNHVHRILRKLGVSGRMDVFDASETRMLGL